MLSSRRETILRYVVEQYIGKATPVPSQSIVDNYTLGISPATIRNEMASLEREGYIIRPYSSSGSIPSDKGYRFYVESLDPVALPTTEQQLINHLFHQVEKEMVESLHLAATLMARISQNIAVVTTPRFAGCRFKRLGLVAVQESRVLVIAVLQGAKIRQKIVSFTEPISEEDLNFIANKFSASFTGMSHSQIASRIQTLNATEKQIADVLLKLMEAENEEGSEEPYLQGLHYLLNQPEFIHTRRFLDLMELVEEKRLLNAIRLSEPDSRGVKVIIGRENQAEVLQDYSIVVSQYGLPEEATGTIGVIGPTRMPYVRVISAIDYLSAILSRLVTAFYEGSYDN